MDDEIIFFNQCIHPWTMLKTIEVISKRINAGKFTQHVVVNVAKLVNMRKNPELRRSVAECDIINVDSMGVVWGARLCGHNVPERVAGIDLLLQLLEFAKKKAFQW